MKNKIFSGVLISLVFPICGKAVTVTGDELNIGTGNTVLAGSKSGAIGYSNEAANGSLAVGDSNLVTGGASFAAGVGFEIDSLTYYSAGVGGYGGIAKSEYSLSLGYMNWITGESGSLVGGMGNTITSAVNQRGSGNILLGVGNTLDKAAIGGGWTVGSTVLIGNGNESSVGAAWVVGMGNIGQFTTVTLGTYASTVTDASLVVGTGTAVNARSNGFVVLKNGTVQIPSGNLVLGSESAITPSYLTSNLYLKKATGTGSTAASDAVLAIGAYANAGAVSSISIGDLSSATGPASIAIGGNSKATTQGSTAIGDGSWAVGSYNSLAMMGGRTGVGEAGRESAAIGPSATTSGPGAFAVGYGAHATTFSSAFGSSNASGWASSAFGHSTASGDMSLAMGYGSQAQGSTSVAHGKGSQARKNASIAIGHEAIADGEGAISLGAYTVTNGSISTAIGYSVTANSRGATSLGVFNAPSVGSGTTWVQTDALLELGNGEDDTHRSNALTTLKNGRTTLTNKFWVSTTPEVVPAAANASAGEALAVEGHAKVKGNATIDGTTTLNGKVILAEAQGDISMGIYE